MFQMDPRSLAQWMQQGQQATQNINSMPFTYNYGMGQSQVVPGQVQAAFAGKIPEGTDPMAFYAQQGSPALPMYASNGGGLGGLGGLFQTPDMLKRLIEEALKASGYGQQGPVDPLAGLGNGGNAPGDKGSPAGVGGVGGGMGGVGPGGRGDSNGW